MGWSSGSGDAATQFPVPEEFGAAGNGVTDDTGAMLKWMASGKTGLALLAGSNYLIGQPIVQPSSVKAVTGNNAMITAGQVIADFMWKTSGTARLEYATIQDIVFDANQLAQAGMILRWGGRVDLDNLMCLDPTLGGFQVGDATASATSFGIKSRGMRVDRIQATALVAGSKGLFVDAADDCAFYDPELVGFETGISVNGTGNRFYYPHAWGHTVATLPVTCFDDNGGDNEWIAMDADSPSANGLRIRKNARVTLVGGRCYNGPLVPDDTAVGIRLDTALTPLVMSGVAFVASDTNRMATDVVGDLSIANVLESTWSSGTQVVVQNAVPRMRNVLTASVNGATTLARPIVEVRASVTLAAPGAVTVNAATSQWTKVFLQANASACTISNPLTGMRFTLMFSQDATGARSYVWPADCRFNNDVPPVDPLTANTNTSVIFYRDSTGLWTEESRAVSVPNS